MELIIGDHNHFEHQESGEGHLKGLVPRDLTKFPCYGSALPYEAVDVPLIPQSEWADRVADKTAGKRQMSDIRLTGNNGGVIPSQDQNGKGYCWAHNPTGAVMLLRAVMGMPYVGLSAYAVACMIKNFQDEGGWAALGLDFITLKGVPSEEFWPMRSMSRSNNNAATWENAAKHKCVEGWVDLNAAVYDRKLTDQQICSLILSGIPVCGDFNWWGHSVCIMDLVNGSTQLGITRSPSSGKLMELAEFEMAWGMQNPVTMGFGKRIWNSWGDSWSDRGMGILTGSKALADGAVAPRAVTASMA